ncbi:hypothetical protein AGDE_00182 [Angomonas deanei]|uniref:C3H1-type domain-containing protein n=1 Tax=Angomonas deanei TaxID=59799 RepID=S9WQN7_9TRYP|nr:hypothetical protein AGDE_02414 [Angomonas deanei]EPY41666.1 hypothetical protein AGDE_02258 [Angomonas deanei]EPY43739.1 hypothetical protein AGDE_00182 [Angomonas deanei]CAD2215365.1 hypothetical protein, conserved [Angomonas deanei]|eukprot:EPY41510.1 hypothetical protein AGDE_02414 [Angomonas deanei]
MERRVLGAQRTLSEAVSKRNDNMQEMILKIAKNDGPFTLKQLEDSLSFLANKNSNYLKVGEQEIHILADELLNNSIRSVLVYDQFTGAFSDMEMYCISLVFQQNLSVEAVTLSGIVVSDESIVALCESLVNSRVGYLDVSNTPLEDEAGHSLAALAHVNPYLRTVVVGETLISEDVLDEIDVACQFNQSNFEGSGDAVDESLFKEKDIGRLKNRLQKIIRAKYGGVHYCVANAFGCCPNGDACLSSHSLNTNEDRLGKELALKITELFTSGGDWEDRLPPPPREGASWAGAAGEKKEIKLNLKLRKQRRDAKGKKKLSNLALYGAIAAGISVACIFIVKMKLMNSSH